jgi:FKBP-type peptidyl-prolyl cis-trans isomerase
MRSFITAALALFCLSAAAYAQQDAATQAPELKTVKDKASYAIGQQIGETLKARSFDVDLNILTRGIMDALAGAKPALAPEEIQDAMVAFQREAQVKAAEKAKLLGEKNQKEGDAFLAANKTKEGVVTTPSGLQFKVLKRGAGKVSPKATDTVTTHYRGTLIDGTEFDSSLGGEPVSFPVGGVIAGWTEALQLMRVGDKYQLFIPASLAYKERGAGGRIGPNATLVFEVELLGIEAAPANPNVQPKP